MKTLWVARRGSPGKRKAGRLRRGVIALAAVTLTASATAVAAQPAAAGPQTVDFELVFHASPGNSCDPGVLVCGTVLVPRFGRATATFTGTGFEFLPPNCFRGTGIVGITLEEDGSTLRLATEAVACTPGASGSSPGNLGPSRGDPFQGDGTWSVIDGSGVFAGATGGGTGSAVNAGDVTVARYSGTITLP